MWFVDFISRAGLVETTSGAHFQKLVVYAVGAVQGKFLTLREAVSVI